MRIVLLGRKSAVTSRHAAKHGVLAICPGRPAARRRRGRMPQRASIKAAASPPAIVLASHKFPSPSLLSCGERVAKDARACPAYKYVHPSPSSQRRSAPSFAGWHLPPRRWRRCFARVTGRGCCAKSLHKAVTLGSHVGRGVSRLLSDPCHARQGLPRHAADAASRPLLSPSCLGLDARCFC